MKQKRRAYQDSQGLWLLPLTQGQVALIDEEDLEWASEKNWCASFNPSRSTFYATHSYWDNVDGTRSCHSQYLHKEIARRYNAVPDGYQVDHISTCTLDNRRSNLRVVTLQENLRNKRRYRSNLSGIKGVSFRPKLGKWVAEIQVDRQRVYLGVFSSPEAAGAAYAEASLRYHGEYGRTDAGSNS